MDITHIIASRLGLTQRQVEATVNLLAEGATIPFISRYRKEATGGLNEVQIAQINDLNDQLTEFERRKAYIMTRLRPRANSPTNCVVASRPAKKPVRLKTSISPSSPNVKRVPRQRDKKASSHSPTGSCGAKEPILRQRPASL